GRSSTIVCGSQWTYDALDKARYIVLVAGDNNNFHVAVVGPVFDRLLHQAKENPAVTALMRACNMLPRDLTAALDWQGFEEFCVRFEAAREMFFFNRATRERFQPYITLREFYSGGLMHESTGRIAIKLSEHVDVLTAVHRFPECLTTHDPTIEVKSSDELQPPISWDSTDYRCKNADGAPCDSFCVREIENFAWNVENTAQLIVIDSQ